MQPIRELDEHDADVLRHRQQHLADVLGLLLLLGSPRAELGQLGHAVDELSHAGAEALLDVAQLILGVLGNVVQQGGLDRLRVEPELGEGARDGQRMGHVRLAARPPLRAVRLDRKLPRLADLGQIGRWMVRYELGFESSLGRVERAAAIAERKGSSGFLTGARTRPTLPRRGQWLDGHRAVQCNLMPARFRRAPRTVESAK